MENVSGWSTERFELTYLPTADLKLATLSSGSQRLGSVCLNKCFDHFVTKIKRYKQAILRDKVNKITRNCLNQKLSFFPKEMYTAAPHGYVRYNQHHYCNSC